jgi:hypothetical protein
MDRQLIGTKSKKNDFKSNISSTNRIQMKSNVITTIKLTFRIQLQHFISLVRFNSDRQLIEQF